VWPLGAKKTLERAAELGIPTVLERPNAHTRFAYSVVRSECERIGVPLPPDQEHAYNEEILQREEEEYERADFLLCPSDFVAKTFLAEGFPPAKLLRHTYGYDPSKFHLAAEARHRDGGLVVLFVGVAAVRKGLHFALEAWVRSPASESGRFMIVGEFLPAYREYLAPLLSHPSVEVLGHRDDVPELMRTSDALVLPTLEEGFPLVCLEAVASGCVLLVSDVCTNLCSDGYNGLVHTAGDVNELTAQITALHEDPALLERLRDGAIGTAPGATWEQAGRVLVDAYGQAIARTKRAPVRDAAA
jgi:glycosyltransferase involved in cell wall biosynthesis